MLGSHSLIAGAVCMTETWFLIKGLDDEVERLQSPSPAHACQGMEAVLAFVS